MTCELRDDPRLDEVWFLRAGEQFWVKSDAAILMNDGGRHGT